ncbi:hypothetical protein OKW38_005154 [Paraburkholderia sp. MM5496-R1]|uniref:hypothetical protein n=1 Tax=Paraburkholderia sp. MM5496-R1 TaxID=2991065 RepID=UPI003D1D2D40
MNTPNTTSKAGAGASGAQPLAATQDSAKGGATGTVTVARGRSIRHDGKTYTAGQSVTLAAADVARLRARGFIAPDRDATQAEDEEKARTQGPTFESTDGPAVKTKR